MIWWVILIEAIIFAGIFTTIVLTAAHGDKKYNTANIANYPPDIQEEFFKTHERMEVSYRSKKVILTKSLGILMFTAILFVSSLFAGAKTFLEGFLLSFGLMVWIGAYDTFFIDWVLFANLKMYRLEGTEHMDKAYRQKWFHLKGALFPGLIFALIPSSIVGLLTMLVGGIY